MSDELVFFHAPQTRSYGVAVLLEELSAPHELRVLDLKAGEHRQPAYRGVNPMGKVPAILHRGALVTEQAAVYQYLAELFPAAGLSPAVGDADRGPYLRWLAFYGSCFEPAILDRALKREPGRPSTSPYGTFETMFDTVSGRLAAGSFIAGDRLTAADILWCSALRWVTAFGLLPPHDAVADYLRRIGGRPSFARISERDAALAGG